MPRMKITMAVTIIWTEASSGR